MATYVGLIRAINVGGKNLIAMADLRRIAESIHLTGVSTLLQSGNLVFQSASELPKEIEVNLERELEHHMGMHIDVIVLPAEKLRHMIADNPFSAEVSREPSRVFLMVMKGEIDVERMRELHAKHDGPEQIVAGRTHLYLSYPQGMGTSKLTGQRIESALGVRGTARNWNTVLKIADACSNLEIE